MEVLEQEPGFIKMAPTPLSGFVKGIDSSQEFIRPHKVALEEYYQSLKGGKPTLHREALLWARAVEILMPWHPRLGDVAAFSAEGRVVTRVFLNNHEFMF